jgi:DNA polymerase-3 subunit theta
LLYFCRSITNARQERMMGYNLAELTPDEMNRINVDLAASGVAFKERYNMPVVPELVEREQPEALRDYFRERVAFYRSASHNYSRLPYEPKMK